MNNTIEQVTINQCTGCGACYNMCPVNAISMEEDSEGFLSPVINKSICIDCGKCVRVCSAVEYSKSNESDSEFYAVWHNDDIRMKSSSGGAFTLLSEYILEQGGYVCGATFDKNWKVEHILINDKSDLVKLRGSKYVQSEIGRSFSEIKILLDKNKPVLFSGCPCQVAGLQKFLQKDYSNLITIDIVCHGVPSPKAWRKYLLAREKNIKHINFRDKTKGWGSTASIEFVDGEKYYKDCWNDSWYIGFLQGISTRRSCSECKFSNINRIGDFTLGDFWGVSAIDVKLDDKKGTGLLIVNSPKAKEIYSKLEQLLILSKNISIEDVVTIAKTRNGQLLYPKKSHQSRQRFFEILDNISFDKAVNQCVNNTYDVGVVGWWYNENYGGTLTYYALHQALKSMGFSVLMISKASSNKNYEPQWNSVPLRFAKKHYHYTENYHPNELGKTNKFCKAFVSGSDQLFNPNLWQYSGPQYFLDFASPNAKIVSYASSFGNIEKVPDDFANKTSHFLHRFDALSSREDYGVDLFAEGYGLIAQKVIDPVFLIDPMEYIKLTESVSLEKPSSYLVSFILDPDDEKREIIQNACQFLKMDMVNLLHAADVERNAQLLNLPNTKKDLDLEEWIYYYNNSDFVITDSFHGTCLAIILEKQFISIANLKRGEKRFISILNELGLLSRLIYKSEDITHNQLFSTKIDYESVSNILKALKNESYNWLQNALMNKASYAKNIFKLMDKKTTVLKNSILEMQHKMYQLEKNIENLNNSK